MMDDRLYEVLDYLTVTLNNAQQAGQPFWFSFKCQEIELSASTRAVQKRDSTDEESQLESP